VALAPERTEPPTLDGDLHEWSLHDAVTLRAVPMPGAPSPNSKELSAQAAFAFDREHLYVAISVRDTEPVTQQRGWRYGDGVMLTLGDPGAGDGSPRFVTLGLARSSKGDPTPTVVNRDGTFFPDRGRKPPVQLAIRAAKDAMVYEVAIPWSAVEPLRPLVHRRWGVNVTVTSAGAGGRKRLQYVADMDADTEQTPWRRLGPLVFRPAALAQPRCQISLPRRFGLMGWSLVGSAGCVGTRGKGVTLELKLRGHERATTLVQLPAGADWRSLDAHLPIPTSADGETVLWARAVVDGTQVTEASANIHVLGATALGLVGALQEMARGPQKDHPLFPSFAARLDWISALLREASPWGAAPAVRAHLQEAQELAAALGEGAAPFQARGRTFRYVHRSPLDGAALPYSAYVPGDHDPAQPGPLLVVLHGSGVDERGTLARAVRDHGKRGWVILAPQARGLSDWYVGPAESAVLEAMDHLATHVPFDPRQVVLDGFSMGGYGAWRLALRHQERFGAVAVRSGATGTPPFVPLGEPVAALAPADASPVPELLVLHGAKDAAVPVAPVRELVGILKKRGARLEYVELPDAAHGNYDESERVAAFFEAHLSQRR